MTIKADGGNVGIGTTSPDTYSYGGTRKFLTFTATATNEEPFLQLIANGVGNSIIDFGNATIRRATIIGFDGSHLAFYTNGSNSGTSVSERMRITSGGSLKASNSGSYLNSTAAYHELRQGTTDTNIAIFSSTAASPYGPNILFGSASPNNTTNYFLLCSDSSANRFIVYSNGNVANTNGSYGSISDSKLKENIKDATPKLDDLIKIKIRNYNLIGDDQKQIGVIAQELEEIFPSLIDMDGKTNIKSVKYSVFVPMLIKAIQELKQEIDTLKN